MAISLLLILRLQAIVEVGALELAAGLFVAGALLAVAAEFPPNCDRLLAPFAAEVLKLAASFLHPSIAS